jgi:hypothetical protein
MPGRNGSEQGAGIIRNQWPECVGIRTTVITSFHQTSTPDPEGKFAWVSKLTGEILKGTGRFEGIKGNLSGEGKQFKPEKGDLVGKSTVNYTFTYTLPSK